MRTYVYWDLANSKHIWHAVLKEGSELGIEPEPREPPPPNPPSLVWDENSLRVRRWGGGGMPENFRRTEVSWLCVCIYTYHAN